MEVLLTIIDPVMVPVTTAMMATLATTAAPKFSGVGEGAKEKKTLADIDKIMKAANNFYNTQVTESGRGRFPGQTKFDKNVPETGGYGSAVDQNGTSLTVDAELNLDLVGVPGSGQILRFLPIAQLLAQSGYLFLELQTPI